MHESPKVAFVGLGSNLGDKELSLEQARQHLIQPEVRILQTSRIYATEPVDFLAQDWFLNQVICIETSLSPKDLLSHCLRLERKMGRKRSTPRGPRSIDLDVLLYEDRIVEEEGITIPHPRMHLRRFVLVPLAAIAPAVVHPILKQTITRLLELCPDRSKVALLK